VSIIVLNKNLHDKLAKMNIKLLSLKIKYLTQYLKESYNLEKICENRIINNL